MVVVGVLQGPFCCRRQRENKGWGSGNKMMERGREKEMTKGMVRRGVRRAREKGDRKNW